MSDETKQQVEEAVNNFFTMLPAETIADELHELATLANQSREIKLKDQRHRSNLNFTAHQTAKFLKNLSEMFGRSSKNTVNLFKTTLN
jgi:hypothetical protein